MSAVTTAPPVTASMLQIMRRPRSLLMLGGFILLAVVFALFGQWQLSRAVQAGTVVERPTEQVLPLGQVADPATSVSDEAIGQLVSASGEWMRGEFQILSDRLDEGRSGYWVIGHFRTDDGDSLAVGLGWTGMRRVRDRRSRMRMPRRFLPPSAVASSRAKPLQSRPTARSIRRTSQLRLSSTSGRMPARPTPATSP